MTKTKTTVNSKSKSPRATKASPAKITSRVTRRNAGNAGKASTASASKKPAGRVSKKTSAPDPINDDNNDNVESGADNADEGTEGDDGENRENRDDGDDGDNDDEDGGDNGDEGADDDDGDNDDKMESSQGEENDLQTDDEDDFLEGLTNNNVINVTTAQAVEALESCNAKDVQKFKNSIMRTALQRKANVPPKERNAHIREDLQLKIAALLEGHPHMLAEMDINVDPIESIPWKTWNNELFFKVLLRILKGAKAKTELANRGVMFLNDFVASAAKIQLTGYKHQLDSLIEARDKLYMQHGAVTEADREDLVTKEQYHANRSKLMKILNFNGANGFMLLVHQEISDLGDKIKTFSQWCRAVQHCYYLKVDQTDAMIALRETQANNSNGNGNNINKSKRKTYEFQKGGVNKFTNLVHKPSEQAASGGSSVNTDSSYRPSSVTFECNVCGGVHPNAPCRFWNHRNANHEKGVPWAQSKNGQMLKELGVTKLDKYREYNPSTKAWTDVKMHDIQSRGQQRRQSFGGGRGGRGGIDEVRSIMPTFNLNQINTKLVKTSNECETDMYRCSMKSDASPQEGEVHSQGEEIPTPNMGSNSHPRPKPASVTVVRAVVADGSRTRGSRSDAVIKHNEDPQLLLDSGTKPNFITEQQRKSWNIEVKTMDTKIKIKTIHGSAICDKYVVIPCLSVIYKNHVVSIRNRKFLIVPDLPFPIILGLESIRDFDLTTRFKTYFTNKKEREARSERSRVAFNSYLNRHSQRLWELATEEHIKEKLNTNQPSEGAPSNLASGNSLGQWVKQHPVATQTGSEVDLGTVSSAPTDVPVRTVVDKSVLLDDEELDNDHIDEEVDDPWDRYFNNSQQPTLYAEEAERLRSINADVSSAGFKWNIQCKDEHRSAIEQVLNKYKQQFKSTVGSEPALLPPFDIQISKQQWTEMRGNKGYVRPQSPEKMAAIRKFIEQALVDGVIAPSQAAQFSQVLLTPKSNGSWRFCIDYRALNSVSEGQGWPIPNIKAMLQRIGSQRPTLFAVMDLTSGYHQAPLAKASQEYTAFITYMGLYKWLRVPMGPKGAPSYFQHQMVGTVLPGLVHTICEVYLDDICVYATSIKQFCENLDKVLARLKKHNITLNPEKCRFGLSEVEYVGHVINSQGLSFSSAKLDKVQTFRQPETPRALKQFLGLASYFRDHIRNHADIVQPLQDLMVNTKSHAKLVWTEASLKALDNIKEAIINCPTLHWLVPGHPVFVHTDASDFGIGAYLYQVIDGKETPIAFISKTLNTTERKWSTIEKEAYAIFYSLTKWEHYLRDIKFTLRTDHKNLTYIKLEHKQKVQRWKLAIQQYSFLVEHIKGEDNLVADRLSRWCEFEVAAPTEHQDTLLMLIEDTPERDLVQENLVLPPIDPHPKRNNNIYKDNYVIPRNKFQIIGRCHNTNLGHFGVNETISKVRKHLANTPKPDVKSEEWSTTELRQDVTAFIKRCPCCQKMTILKPGIHTQGYTTSTWGVFDNIAIDVIMGLPSTSAGNSNIMVIIDTFSRYIELYPMGSLTSQAAAKALEQWMCRYGRPINILTDNASQFQAEYDATLKVLGIYNQKTHPYSHEENAIVERANKEIIRHLRNILFETKIYEQWEDHLPAIMRIKNTTPVSSTGVAPAELVFGTSYRLERGLLYPAKIVDDIPMPMHAYLQQQYKIQHAVLAAAYRHQDSIDDKHQGNKPAMPSTEFDIDSYVLVQYENDTRSPPSKVHPLWRGPYQIVSIARRDPKAPIYTCRNMATNKIEDFHIKLLKQYQYDQRFVDPAEAAMADTQLFEVEEILDHLFEGKKQLKTTMKFKIKWRGYPNPTWEPYKNLRDVERLHTYLKAHKLAKFVPDSYKDSKESAKKPPVVNTRKRSREVESDSSERHTRPKRTTTMSNK
jgi:hypothetical protein